MCVCVCLSVDGRRRDVDGGNIDQEDDGREEFNIINVCQRVCCPIFTAGVWR